MLFSDILEVNASSGYGKNDSITLSFTLYPDSSSMMYSISSMTGTSTGSLSLSGSEHGTVNTNVTTYSGSTSSTGTERGSISISSVSGSSTSRGHYSLDGEIPINIILGNVNQLDYAQYYWFSAENEALSTNLGSVIFEGCFWKGTLISERNYCKVSEIVKSGSPDFYRITPVLKFHLSDVALDSHSNDSLTFTLTYSFYIYSSVTDSASYGNSGIEVHDTNTENALNE